MELRLDIDVSKPTLVGVEALVQMIHDSSEPGVPVGEQWPYELTVALVS